LHESEGAGTWFEDTASAGWLAIDKNHDGIINDGSELLGSNFSPTASNGFAALLELNPTEPCIAAGNATFDSLVI
jgi:hypothetical protein